MSKWFRTSISEYIANTTNMFNPRHPPQVLRFSDIDKVNGFLRITPIAVRITLINVRCFPPVKSGSHEIT